MAEFDLLDIDSPAGTHIKRSVWPEDKFVVTPVPRDSLAAFVAHPVQVSGVETLWPEKYSDMAIPDWEVLP